MPVERSDVGDDQNMLVVVTLNIELEATKLTQFGVVEEDLLRVRLLRSVIRGQLIATPTAPRIDAGGLSDYPVSCGTLAIPFCHRRVKHKKAEFAATVRSSIG
jgi:hypothetical protein